MTALVRTPDWNYTKASGGQWFHTFVNVCLLIGMADKECCLRLIKLAIYYYSISIGVIASMHFVATFNAECTFSFQCATIIICNNNTKSLLCLTFPMIQPSMHESKAVTALHIICILLNVIQNGYCCTEADRKIAEWKTTNCWELSQCAIIMAPWVFTAEMMQKIYKLFSVMWFELVWIKFDKKLFCRVFHKSTGKMISDSKPLAVQRHG